MRGSVVSCSDGMDFRRFFGDGWFLAGSGGCRVVICERGEENPIWDLSFSFKKSEVYQYQSATLLWGPTEYLEYFFKMWFLPF
jgi:hypothetical protein